MTAAILLIEVVERVIDFVYGSHYDDTDIKTYAMLKACALTCRAMTPRSQYWLFRQIILRSQWQADSLMHVLRMNPAVARHTRLLAIVGPLIGETGQNYSWISWLPLLLAPRMTNLTHLHLEDDVFTGSHPNFSRALTAFKSIRRLTMHQVQFSTFGHCTRFIQAFPHLDHLAFQYVSWKRPLPDSLHPQPPPSTSRTKSPIVHLDLWSNTPGDPGLRELTNWFIRVQGTRALRTLNLQVQCHGLVQSVLRCGPFVRSVYLILGDHSPVHGFEDLPHLQTCNVSTFQDTFPLHTVTSIMLSTSSQQIRSLTIYIKANEERGDDQANTQQPDGLDSYRILDDALCNRLPNVFHLKLCLYNTTSEEVVPQWRKRLRVLLPKFCALERLRVYSIMAGLPIMELVELRDSL